MIETIVQFNSIFKENREIIITSIIIIFFAIQMFDFIDAIIEKIKDWYYGIRCRSGMSMYIVRDAKKLLKQYPNKKIYSNIDIPGVEKLTKPVITERYYTDEFGIEHKENYCSKTDSWIEDDEYLTDEELKEIFENNEGDDK